MPRVFNYIVVVSVLTCITHAQQVSTTIMEDQISEEPRNDSSFKFKVYEELFKKSFGHQRKEHADAMKRLQKIDNYERLYKMIMILGERMVAVIETSRMLIENADFNPEDRILPQNITVQSAISTVLENTALFSDILLHFPSMVHRILKLQQNWKTIIDWSINFSNRSRHLLDEKTITTINLIAQELNITERESRYINSHRQVIESRERNKEETKAKKFKKEKQKRGPQITKIEL